MNKNSDIKQFFEEVEAENIRSGNMTYLIVHDGKYLQLASIALRLAVLVRVLAFARTRNKPTQLGIKYLDVDAETHWDEFPLIDSTGIRMMSPSFMSLQRFITNLN